MLAEQEKVQFSETTSRKCRSLKGNLTSESDFKITSNLTKPDSILLPVDSPTTTGSIPKTADCSSSDRVLQHDTKGPSQPAEEDEFIPPDGGFGWVVAIAACFANVWIVGFTKSYSILYLEIRDNFPDNTAYEASWIPVMLSTLGLIVSPLIGMMCRRYNERMVASVGGLLCFLGLFLSTFTTTLIQMVFSLGVVTGLGRGMVQTSAVLIVNMYFKKHRALASAICVAGSALGGFIMPPLIEYLLKEYKLQGTLLIASGLQLHILCSTFVFRPTREHALIQARQRRKDNLIPPSEPTIVDKTRLGNTFKAYTADNEQHMEQGMVTNTASKNGTNIKNSNDFVAVNNNDNLKYSHTPSSNNECRCDGRETLMNEEYQSNKKDRQHESSKISKIFNSCLNILRGCIDKEVFHTVSMILTCISTSLFFLGTPNAYYFLHAYFTSVDVDTTVVTMLLSLASIVDLSGRLIVGYVADLNVISLGLLYFLCTGLSGTCVFCIPFARSVPSIAMVLCGYGFGVGGFVVLMPTTLARNHGIDKLSSSYSFVLMLHGVMNFISPQICGLLADLTGSYASVYYFMGTAMMLSSVLQKSKDTNKKPVENEAGYAKA